MGRDGTMGRGRGGLAVKSDVLKYKMSRAFAIELKVPVSLPSAAKSPKFHGFAKNQTKIHEISEIRKVAKRFRKKTRQISEGHNGRPPPPTRGDKSSHARPRRSKSARPSGLGQTSRGLARPRRSKSARRTRAYAADSPDQRRTLMPSADAARPNGRGQTQRTRPDPTDAARPSGVVRPATASL